MFQNLSQKLQGIFQKLSRAGRIKEEHIDEATREIKLALLEADVNYQVVKTFIDRVKEKAIGQKITESLSPTQQIIKIVNEELTAILGQTSRVEAIQATPAKVPDRAGWPARTVRWELPLQMAAEKPTVMMLTGLQGSGKTTTAAKLGRYFKKMKFKPLLVALDPYRPAAVEQLKKVGALVEVPVFALENSQNVPHITRESLIFAKRNNFDVIIMDTAGRLHIDEEMMNELAEVKEIAQPTEILLVADGLTGQDAVNLARAFNEKINLTGIILTKLDGDARGGAALSMATVTGCQIKFVGVGEKFDDLEVFHPDRVASRILGMGDVLSLIEKVQENIDWREAEKLEKKMRQQEFSLTDFAGQIKQLRKMGPFEKILGMVPGMEFVRQQIKEAKVEPKRINRIEAMIFSMTAEERQNPDIIDGQRRGRIAKGSGTTVWELNQFLKQFFEAKKMMKKMAQMMGSGKNPRQFLKY
jgi:signal recognition particle subunit SRP54